jgi:hypothetical protein
MWYMNTATGIEINAAPSVVWAVFAEVQRWPEWTESVTRVEPLDGAELAIGRRFAISQPRFPRLVWQVTALDPGVSWTWSQKSAGSRVAAEHVLAPIDGGRTLVRQAIDQSGPFGVVVGRLTRRLTVKYLDMEAQGLKQRCELVASGGSDSVDAPTS